MFHKLLVLPAFFVFILLLVVCIVVFKFFNLKRNKFSLSQDHINKLAEHMKTSADIAGGRTSENLSKPVVRWHA